MNTINHRINELALKFFENNNVKFAKFLETSEANVRNYRKSTSPKIEVLQKICENLEINYEWLLTGEGEMLKSNIKNADSQVVGIPLIPFEALAGIPITDNIGVAFEDCKRYVIPDFINKGVEFLIRISGNSMYPKYSNGDILACRRVTEMLFFQWGKVYVIDSSQGALVKRIFEDKNNQDYIILHSDNKDYYPEFLFPKSDIRSLSIVVGVIRLE